MRMWTDAYKAQIPDHEFARDGLFYMTIDDFRAGFLYYTITYYHDDWNLNFYE
jgi:hypothetical protein